MATSLGVNGKGRKHIPNALCMIFLIIAQALFVLPNRVGAYSSGIWSPVSGSVIHHEARVVLLSNGDAVAIGSTNQEPTLPIQVYNQNTNDWSLAAEISSGRQSALLAALPNQRALIAGGHNGTGVTNEAFVFDNNTGLVNSTSSLIHPVQSAKAHTLSDGRVVVIGGFDGANHISEPQIFDPVNESWALGQSFPLSSVASDSILLANDQIIARAGPNESSGNQERVFIYDANNDTWVETGSLAPFVGFNGRFTLLDGEKIMAFSIGSVEIWDPSTQLWTSATPLPVFGGIFGTASLSDGDVLVSTTQGTFVYNSGSELWSQAPDFPDNNNWDWEILNDSSLLVVIGTGDQEIDRSYRFISTENQNQTILLPSADTNVRSGHPDRNYGAGSFVQIQSSGSNRGLVKFDQAAIDSAVGSGTILSATLRLTITDNGNNWGTTGRTVDVYRLLKDWVEGSGTENDRGSGGGATWNCATDSLIENLVKNCSGTTEWEMGQPNNPPVHPWSEAATATQVITNGQSGVVEYDVTADIIAFLNGEFDNYGWIIKKTNESQTGQVGFGTRESAFVPELAITYQP